VNRGEVWWAELAGDAGYRPVAIVSRASPDLRRKIIVAEVTTVIRSLPSEVPLSQKRWNAGALRNQYRQFADDRS
jgi:mRNA-degrading endonuclease toxin of MazEF toxin-antitoxin module